MPTSDAHSALRISRRHFDPSTEGPISFLKDRLHSGISADELWPYCDEQAKGQTISVFEEHADWYGEVRKRVLSRSWHPSLLRVICADPRTAAKEATWLRKSLLPNRTEIWRRGEYVRAVDPIIHGGQEVSPAGTEYRIQASRLMVYGDHQGAIHWETPGGKARTLEFSIQHVEVMALRLEPLDGSDAVPALVELPGRDFWRQACTALKGKLKSASHAIDAHQQGRELLHNLSSQVIRLRPASCITPELIGDRQFKAAALHSDLLDDPGLAEIAIESAERELLVLRK